MCFMWSCEVSIGQGATGDKLTCNPKVKQTVIVMDERREIRETEGDPLRDAAWTDSHRVRRHEGDM